MGAMVRGSLLGIEKVRLLFLSGDDILEDDWEDFSEIRFLPLLFLLLFHPDDKVVFVLEQVV